MKKSFLFLAFGSAALVVLVAFWIFQQSSNKGVFSFQISQLKESVVAFFSKDGGSDQGSTTPEDLVAKDSLKADPSPAQPRLRKTISAEGHLQYGEQALIQNQFEKALAEFSAAALLKPADPVPLLRLAETQLKLKEFDKAYANLKAAENLDPASAELFLLQGQLFLREANFPAARDAFQKSKLALFEQGLLAAFYDELPLARELLTPLADRRASAILSALDEYKMFPDVPKTYQDALFVRAFNEIEEYELALAKIKPVLAADVDYRDAWILLGYAHFALGEHEQARSAFTTAYSLDSTKPETQYFLAKTHFALGNFAEAEKFLRSAYANQLKIPNFINELSEILIAQGKSLEAAELLTTNLRQNQKATLTEFEQVILLWLEGVQDGAKAWELTKSALNRFPKSPATYNLAGLVSFENNFLPEARSQLQQALTLDKNFAPALLNLGKVYEKLGDVQAALKHYEKAFQLASEDKTKVEAARLYNTLLEKS